RVSTNSSNCCCGRIARFKQFECAAPTKKPVAIARDGLPSPAWPISYAIRAHLPRRGAATGETEPGVSSQLRRNARCGSATIHPGAWGPWMQPNDTTPRSAEHASDPLFAEVYARLKAMAGRQLRQHRRDTLDTTALVHELYLRVSAHPELTFEH